MNTLRIMGTVGLLALLGACASTGSAPKSCSACSDHFDDHTVALKSVPTAVVTAAQKAVPGFVAREAQLDHNGLGTYYKLEGYSGQRKYEIAVSKDGKVLDIDRD